MNGHACLGLVLTLHCLQLFFGLVDAIVRVLAIHLEAQEEQLHESNLLRVFGLQEDVERHLQLFLVVVVFDVNVLRQQHFKAVALHEQIEDVLHVGVLFGACDQSDQQLELFLLHVLLLRWTCECCGIINV